MNINKKFYYGILTTLAGSVITSSYIITDSCDNYLKTECKVFFTPGQNCTKKIIDQIDNAKEEILLQAYSFTSEPIANALIKAQENGIKVVCLFDKSQANQLLILKLNHYKINVKIDHLPGIAHNKVIIIDKKIVLTGSFNFTKAAQHRNAENSVHIKSDEIAKLFRENFKSRYKKSRSLFPSVN